MNKKKQLTIEDMKEAMAIELLPAKNKEISRDFSEFFRFYAGF